MGLPRPYHAFGFSLVAGLVCAAGVAFGFAWLAEEVLEGDTRRFDESVRAAVHLSASPSLTTVMRGLSLLGSSALLLALGAFVVFGLFYAGRKRDAILLVLTMAGAVLLEVVLKHSFQRLRPLPFFDTTLPPTFSFPSGHALFSFCFYGAVAAIVTARMRRTKSRVTAWALTATMIFFIGLSRIYLGVHYPSDVIAGFAAAFIWVVAVAFGNHLLRGERRDTKKSKPRRHAQSLSAFALAICLFSYAPLRAQTAPDSSAPAPTKASPVGDGLTFEQVYGLAARDNLQINAVRRRRAVAETGLLIAGQRPNPEIITGYTRSEPRLNLSVAQSIELGGKRARRLEVARGEVRLAELDVEAALRTLRRDVRVAYFNLSLARDMLGLGRQAAAQAEKLVEIAQARFEAGDIAQFEVLQAKLMVARAANDLSRLENAERVARAGLNQLLNRTLDAPLELQDSLFVAPVPVPVSELISRAFTQNVEVRTAVQQIATEQSRLKLARAQRIPDLILEPGIESIDPALPNNYGFKVQVTVPLPIFNRGRGEMARSSALVEQLRAERDATRQRISSEIGQAALRLDAARQQVNFYEAKLLPDAERVRELGEEAYRAGQTGILPVIDAQRGAREVRQGYLQALFDYQSALADLEEAAGVKLG